LFAFVSIDRVVLRLVEASAMSLKSSRKRVRAMQPLGRIMADRGLSQTPDLMLGNVQRLFDTVVGKSLVGECEVVAVHDGKAIVAAKSVEIVRRLKTVEGFILRILAERLDEPTVTSLVFVVRKRLRDGSGKAVAAPITAKVSEKRRAKPTAELQSIADSIACPDLRAAVLKWMELACGQDNQ
jgi:hypothetical protein